MLNPIFQALHVLESIDGIGSVAPIQNGKSWLALPVVSTPTGLTRAVQVCSTKERACKAVQTAFEQAYA